VREPESFDAAAEDRRTPNDRPGDVATDAGVSAPWRVRATAGGRLRALRWGAAPIGARERALDVAAGEGFVLEGSSGEDYRVSAEIEGVGASRVTLYEGFSRAGRSPAGAVALGFGELEVRVPPWAAAPVRVDTRAGRVIVTQGRVVIQVGFPLPAQAAALRVRTVDASATLWAESAGAVRGEALPARGQRVWRLRAEPAAAAPSRELELAAALLATHAPDELALTRASLALCRAASALWATDDRDVPTARWEALWSRASALAR